MDPAPWSLEHLHEQIIAAGVALATRRSLKRRPILLSRIGFDEITAVHYAPT
jgi:hypothetical protein